MPRQTTPRWTTPAHGWASSILVCLVVLLLLGGQSLVFSNAWADNSKSPVIPKPKAKANAKSKAKPKAKKPKVNTDEPEEPRPADDGPKATAVPKSSTQEEPIANLTPRLVLYVQSVSKIVDQTVNSNGGVFIKWVARYTRTRSTDPNPKGISFGEAALLVDVLKQWPDTSIELATFAPNLKGEVRWAVRLKWSKKDLVKRLKQLITDKKAKALFEGVKIVEIDGSTQLTIGDQTVAVVQAAGDETSMIVSEKGLVIPAKPLPPRYVTGPNRPTLVCRLDLTSTEKDSGATALSKVSLVSSLTYTYRVLDNGNFQEQALLGWAPLAGVSAKSVVKRVNDSFFNPTDAFLAGVLNVGAIPTALFQSFNFPTTEFAKVLENDYYFGLLPGDGFFPIPEFVYQNKVTSEKELAKTLKNAIAKANQKAIDDEKPARWHTEKVGTRTYYWNDQKTKNARGLAFFNYYPVILVAPDPFDTDTQVLVIGFTSTRPKNFVEKWLAFTKADGAQVPEDTKNYGQAVLHWKKLYTHIKPWVNVMLSTSESESLLPSVSEVEKALADAQISVDVQYNGMVVTHQGPLPAGPMVVPVMVTSSVGQNQSGSDLARERQAVQRLQVLYHHAKLFHKDFKRWPVKPSELEGYIDFEGNPSLARVPKSSKQEWTQFFKELLGADDDDKKDDDQDTGDILAQVNKVYQITWEGKNWIIEFKPKTFEHLKRLGISQTGDIIRVEAESGNSKPSEKEASKK